MHEKLPIVFMHRELLLQLSNPRAHSSTSIQIRKILSYFMHSHIGVNDKVKWLEYLYMQVCATFLGRTYAVFGVASIDKKGSSLDSRLRPCISGFHKIIIFTLFPYSLFIRVSGKQ